VAVNTQPTLKNPRRNPQKPLKKTRKESSFDLMHVKSKKIIDIVFWGHGPFK
jgi:hypothetical protein